MKKASLFFALIFAMMGIVRADEGMWLPMFVERLNYVDMQKMGLQLTPEELYSINNSSLKDAIVGLSNGDKPRGFFCTGEIVSDNSLLFTNHHCGYSSIAALSTVEHDYLNEGFWARNYSEELPAEGVSASFLVRMEDVTEQILGVVNDTMDWAARQKAISAKAKELEAAASEDGKLNPVVKGFFEGNEYYMFVYKTYTDVRLVGTAPQSIGKFGGDTDNWMWPRHTCDFSVFRVYADANGEPAAYSADNKPLTPKHHLPISLDGVQQDDFTMIWGFPGSTERYMTSYGIDYNVDTFYPIVHDVFKAETDVMDEYMMVDQAVNISYADSKAGLANTWKNFEGQMKMLRKNKVAERKAELEAEFTNWINFGSPVAMMNVKSEQDYNAWVEKTEARQAEYGEVLGTLEAMYAELGELTATLYYPNFVSQLGVFNRVAEFKDYMEAAAEYKSLTTNEKGKPKKQKEIKDDSIVMVAKAMLDTATMALKDLNVDGLFDGLDYRVESKMLVEVLKIYGNQFATEELPESMQELLKKYDGSFESLANDINEHSIFATSNSIKAFVENPDFEALEEDPAVILANGMVEQIYSVIPAYRMANMVISENNHLFVKGLREFYAETQPGKVLYPDANSTLRMSYGSVKDYQPADAISYDYVCTANGVVEKYIPGDFEFDSPKRLIELIEKRDFGQYADKNGELITCFLSTNDITGGNSGSPIMNGKGELIGLAFDGNWEAMSGDVNFEPTLQRTINVDIRYVLFIIDKLSGATNLIDELDIRKAMPEPIRVEDAE
ncbi:MAG: S46 family peptidase [Bacteroidales bacterium]|nr:S46 family peptidase [Bacteroidales bacterium]